jgi:hypothetical protein
MTTVAKPATSDAVYAKTVNAINKRKQNFEYQRVPAGKLGTFTKYSDDYVKAGHATPDSGAWNLSTGFAYLKYEKDALAHPEKTGHEYYSAAMFNFDYNLFGTPEYIRYWLVRNLRLSFAEATNVVENGQNVPANSLVNPTNNLKSFVDGQIMGRNGALVNKANTKVENTKSHDFYYGLMPLFVAKAKEIKQLKKGSKKLSILTKFKKYARINTSALKLNPKTGKYGGSIKEHAPVKASTAVEIPGLNIFSTNEQGARGALTILAEEAPQYAPYVDQYLAAWYAAKYPNGVPQTQTLAPANPLQPTIGLVRQ